MQKNKPKTLRRKVNPEKVISIVITLFVFLSITITTCIVLIAYEPLNAQKEALESKEQLLTEDFENLSTMEDATLEVKYAQYHVTLKEKDCNLLLVYDKDYILVSKEFVDTRLPSEAIVCICLAIFLFIGSILYCVISTLLINKLYGK